MQNQDASRRADPRNSIKVAAAAWLIVAGMCAVLANVLAAAYL